jgi:hypothetical protein
MEGVTGPNPSARTVIVSPASAGCVRFEMSAVTAPAPQQPGEKSESHVAERHTGHDETILAMNRL